MKNLYKVTLERTTYRCDKSIETREIFAESPRKINTYRLGGFQHDSIKILKAKKIRTKLPIEVEVDTENNEISMTVDVDAHLDTTLEKNDKLTALYESSDDFEETLKAMGYKEVTADNTYNYSSDFDNDLNFRVYDLNPDSDWIYSKTAIVVVYEHTGLDVRAGYKFKGVYNGLKHDGFCYFLDFHVRLTVETLDGDHVSDFDGDWAYGRVCQEYTVKKLDKKGNIILTKNGEDFILRYYHPAEGI
jgi:hypothetical protein